MAGRAGDLLRIDAAQVTNEICESMRIAIPRTRTWMSSRRRTVDSAYGTPNRLEYDQGFFVNLGDGAADVKPIAHLYTTQVYQLAEYLGVPDQQVASAAGLTVEGLHRVCRDIDQKRRTTACRHAAVSISHTARVAVAVAVA